MTATETLVANAEVLCRKIAARDLAGVPLYIVCQSALAAEFGRAAGCDGYTTPSLDLYLADHIPRYRGRGPCFVVNDLMLREDRTDDLDYWFTAIALHELAHVLERPAPFEDRTGENPNKIKFECCASVRWPPSRTRRPGPRIAATKRRSSASCCTCAIVPRRWAKTSRRPPCSIAGTTACRPRSAMPPRLATNLAGSPACCSATSWRPNRHERFRSFGIKTCWIG